MTSATEDDVTFSLTHDSKSLSSESEIPARSLAFWEIISIVVSVVIVEWAVLPLAGKNLVVGIIPVALAFALIIYSQRVRGETWRELGWRTDNFAQAARLLLLPTAMAALFLFVAGWYLQTSGFGEPRSRPSASLWLPLWGILWGLVQQYPLQAFVNRRAQILFGRGVASVLVVASVFALLHLPNLWLTIATFVAGCLWAAVYQRAPNLFALAISHSIMTVLLIWTIPDVLLGGLRVGYNYFL